MGVTSLGVFFLGCEWGLSIIETSTAFDDILLASLLFSEVCREIFIVLLLSLVNSQFSLCLIEL